jgi:hypothetical protein
MKYGQLSKNFYSSVKWTPELLREYYKIFIAAYKVSKDLHLSQIIHVQRDENLAVIGFSLDYDSDYEQHGWIQVDEKDSEGVKIYEEILAEGISTEFCGYINDILTEGESDGFDENERYKTKIFPVNALPSQN